MSKSKQVIFHCDSETGQNPILVFTTTFFMTTSGFPAEALEHPRDLERSVSYVLVSILSSSVPLIHFDFEEDLAWVPCRGGANSMHELEGLPVRDAGVIETSLDEKRQLTYAVVC